MSKLRVLDLFSGIGGFSLGLERAGGFETVAFCEIDPFCRRVLAKHWPDVPCAEDVEQREFTEGEADVITGGFPCQDVSFAGRGAGLAGERSGLYRHLIRAIRLVRPRYAILENVAALLSRGMGTVLGDLAEIGADAEWHCIPASAVGAPHRRDRVWIVANPRSEQHESDRAPLSGPLAAQLSAANANDQRQPQSQGPDREERGWFGDVGSPLADAPRNVRTEQATCGAERERTRTGSEPIIVADAWGHPTERHGPRIGAPGERNWWGTEPDVGRVAHGVPSRVDRLRALGNAVVPQIPELIGRALMSVTQSQKSGERA